MNGEESDAKYFSQWAAEKYSLFIIPSVVTTRCLLRNGQEILSDQEQSKVDKKHNRKVKSGYVEKQLVNWINLIYFKKINLTDLFIKEKAIDLLNDHNSRNPFEHQVSMSFSNGCMWKFKKRNGFKMYKSHGEW